MSTTLRAPADPTFGGQWPFPPHFSDSVDGTLHYVDEGEGRAVLMLHGNPTWGFLWRRFIRPVAQTHRVVVPDLLGFGLSERPADPEGLAPERQLSALTALADGIGLDDITLVVHDWGGVIGLAFAARHPGRVRRMVVTDTLPPGKAIRLPTGFRVLFRTPRLSPWLTRRFNVFPRFTLAFGVARGDRPDPAALQAYLDVLPDPSSRLAASLFPLWIPTGHPWRRKKAPRRPSPALPLLEEIAAGRERLAPLPGLILWGGRDPIFGRDALNAWREALPGATAVLFRDASHFLQEEIPERMLGHMLPFLEST